MKTRHRKSPLPSSRTSITQWFRAASQVTNNPPPKGRLSAGAAFPFAHLSPYLRFHWLSAFRHRLYAEGRSQALHIFRVPGRFARAKSELTAQRFKVLFFRRGSTAFRTLLREGSYWSCLSRRSRSYRHFPPLSSLSRQ